MNVIVLIGRLTADPETRFTQSGTQVTNFTLAVDRKFKTSDGEKITDFIRCVAWRKSAELISEHLGKGSQAAFQGSLYQSKWTDNDGNNKTTYEVNVEEFKFIGSPKSKNTEPQKKPKETKQDPEDDLPF